MGRVGVWHTVLSLILLSQTIVAKEQQVIPSDQESASVIWW